jgi:UDP-glucose 6-dehydrogenase
LVVVGDLEENSREIVEEIYSTEYANMIRTLIKTAKMVKNTSNVYHALKVIFAN